jgi:DNA-binding transcriptional ArsR family regulator
MYKLHNVGGRRTKISDPEVAIYHTFLRHKSRWLTNREVADRIGNIAERTVQHHTRRLAKLGILEIAQVFPAPRYRFSEEGMIRNPDYVSRVKAKEVLLKQMERVQAEFERLEMALRPLWAEERRLVASLEELLRLRRPTRRGARAGGCLRLGERAGRGSRRDRRLRRSP